MEDDPTRIRRALDDYYALRELDQEADTEGRLLEQPTLVSRYYDVVTKFYEFAWGTSFHFSPRRRGETLAASQTRHELGVAKLLQLHPGTRVGDIGCGIGGPMLTIGEETGAHLTGLDFNAYQIARGELRARRVGLTHTCSFMLANFMDVPLPDGHFDALYSFESICHAPATVALFRELYRLLRPGGELVAIDWCLTDRFDEQDTHHRDVRDRLEQANGTPDLLTTRGQLAAVRTAGFEVLRSVDQATQCDRTTPWYRALQGRDFSVTAVARIPAGRTIMATVMTALERLKVAPQGIGEAARLLNMAADSVVEAGRIGIFTPMFLVHARKPR